MSTKIDKSPFIVDKFTFIIFLDIDGVVYSGPGNIVSQKATEIFEEVKKKFPQREFKNANDNLVCSMAATHFFDTNAVNNLDHLIKEIEKVYKVGIVISSQWREGYTSEELKIIFSKHNFSKYIIDKTVDKFPEADRPMYCNVSSNFDSSVHGPNCRASEINLWLKKHPECVNFLIIDDNDNHLSKNFKSKFFSVYYRDLLTMRNITEILKNLPSMTTIFSPKLESKAPGSPSNLGTDFISDSDTHKRASKKRKTPDRSTELDLAMKSAKRQKTNLDNNLEKLKEETD